MKTLLGFMTIFFFSFGCRLSSLGEGDCAYSKNLTLNFCKSYVSDYICIPKNQSEWNWTVYDKEDEIRQVYVLEIEKILNLEVQGIGTEFTRNPDCSDSLKSILCQLNFPYCVNGTSYPLCSSNCDYLNKNCLTTFDACSLNIDIDANISICANSNFLFFGMLAVLTNFI